MQKALVLIASLLLATFLAAPDEPMAITSDTKDYCIKLAARLGEDSSLSPHAQVLWERGRSMCESGHVRGGLIRLRRAMQMVQGTVE